MNSMKMPHFVGKIFGQVLLCVLLELAGAVKSESCHLKEPGKLHNPVEMEIA